ncbi:hypothetical protein D3C78_1823000 [compost metagenome]
MIVGTFGASRRMPLMSLAHCHRNHAATPAISNPAPHFTKRTGDFLTGDGLMGS